MSGFQGSSSGGGGGAVQITGYNGSTWDSLRAGLTAVQTAFTGFQDVIPVGKYNAIQPTLVDGNGVALQSDSRGNLKVDILVGVTRNYGNF